jgi:cation:H+ antiporter
VALVDLLVLAGGVALVSLGADGLVRGGSRLARALGVSTLFVGLTVASFGTSLPELVVSVTAAWDGATRVAVGNAVGSNVLNLLGVLGPAAVLVPLAMDEAVVRAEIPTMIGAGLVFTILALNGVLGRLEGLLLIAGVVGYTALRFEVSRERVARLAPEDAPEQPTRRQLAWGGAMVVGGSLALGFGGRLVVDGAVGLARSTGIPGRIIAVVLVAGGTTVPEMATTLAAAWRDRVDLGVGNIVGSCIFNLLLVGGASALVRPLDVVPAALKLEVPAMLLAMFALLPMAATGRRLDRWEGAVLTAGLVAYLAVIAAGLVASAAV